MAGTIRVNLEIGPKGKRVVAVAPDWPGLNRGAKSEEAALERTGARSVHFGEITHPTTVDDLIMNRDALERMLAGTYWS